MIGEDFADRVPGVGRHDGTRLDLPWRPDFNALVYVLSGRGAVGARKDPIQMGQLAVLGAGV